MLAVTLTFSEIISVMFLLVGGVIGYLVKEYVIERNSTYIPMHPEMFDENGQIIPDEVLSVRFENSLEDFQDEDWPWLVKINNLYWMKTNYNGNTSTKKENSNRSQKKLPPNPFIHEILELFQTEDHQ